MHFAVLTISDRCSDGSQEDTAGPAVVALLRREWPQANMETALLKDDEDAIAAKLEELSRKGRRACADRGWHGNESARPHAGSDTARDRARGSRIGGSDAR